MKRREFGRALATVGGAALGVAVSTEPQAQPAVPDAKKRKAPMHVGCQSGGTTVENLEFKARHGVFQIDGDEPKRIEGKGWDLDDSLRKREACEKYGISLEAYHLWHSQGIERTRFPAIMLGQSPQRDRDIEQIQQMIQVAAKTGVRLLNYNTTILGMLRTGRTPDPARGNASYDTWDYHEAVRRNELMTIAGVVAGDEIFERISYLLDRIVPVDEEYKVQLGNHIADPPTHAGDRGITRWNSPDVFAGIKRFADSPKVRTTDSTCASGRRPKGSRTRGRRSTRSSATSARGSRSSTSTCGTSKVDGSTSWRSIPTTATWTSTRWCGRCGTSSTRTCCARITCPSTPPRAPATKPSRSPTATSRRWCRP